MESQGGLSVVQMCGLARLSRATFYRHWEGQEAGPMDTELRDRIQRLYVEKRPNGYRSITRGLKKQGWVVNAKKVRRLMREDNLLGLRKRKFVVTSDHRHDFVVYPNLAQNLVLSDINQLWVADITYLRLAAEFVYLAVVLDGYSRRAIGWALERKLSRDLTLAALEQAIAARQPRPGLVHHSDGGSQYACNAYVERLESIRALASMSRPGRPWENGKCESFIATLKREQLEGRQYGTLEELRTDLERFLETVYNRERMHSALDYLSPAAFEEQQAVVAKPEGWRPAGVSLRRHEEIYSDVSEQGGTGEVVLCSSPDSSE